MKIKGLLNVKVAVICLQHLILKVPQQLLKQKNLEIILSYCLNILNLPIKINKKKNYDLIKIVGQKKIKPFNYKIPSDISSSAFFIVLTALSKNSQLTIKNVNINPTRVGSFKNFKIDGSIKTQIKNSKNL